MCKFSRIRNYNQAFSDELILQDRIWEIEKSWRNNLVFHGILYDDANIDEPAHRTEEKVMCSNTVAYHLVCLCINFFTNFIDRCRYFNALQVRKVIKVDLQMSREIHIIRAQRITTGPQIRGTHPIVVSFENYRDKVRN